MFTRRRQDKVCISMYTEVFDDLNFDAAFFISCFSRKLCRSVEILKKDHFRTNYKYNSYTISNSHHTPKTIENISYVNFLFKSLFKSQFMYPNFSSELNSLDKFFPLTSHTHIFFSISKNWGRSVFRKKNLFKSGMKNL